MQDGRQRPALTSAIMAAQDGAARAPATHSRAAVTAGASAASLLLSSRCVISLDLDCFYAQCEELRRPELKGKPLGVQQKMLVITSNYAARAYGIKKGDSLHTVRQKCPHITIVSGEDLTFYRHVSQRVFDVVSAWSPAVERLGMDELFVDLTDAVDRRMQQEEERAAGSAGSEDLSDGERSSAWLTPCGFLYPSPSPASEADAVRLRLDGRTLCCEDPLSVCAARLAMCSLITEEVRADVRRTLGLTTSAGISVSKLLKLRQALNSSADGKYKLSVNDFLIKAMGIASKKHPAVNSSWQESSIRQYNTVDVSVAVSTPNGLITPIVTGVEGRGLESISNQVKALAKKARDNKLKPEEYQGGTISISNMGMNPAIDNFTAVINPPQAAILAVGTTKKVAVPVENEDGTIGTEWEDQVTVTASFDHKVIDGAVGAEWVREFKKVLENPLELLL